MHLMALSLGFPLEKPELGILVRILAEIPVKSWEMTNFSESMQGLHASQEVARDAGSENSQDKGSPR